MIWVTARLKRRLRALLRTRFTRVLLVALRRFPNRRLRLNRVLPTRGIVARLSCAVVRARLLLVGEAGGVSQGFFRLCPLSAYATMPNVPTAPNPAVTTSGIRSSIEMFFDFGWPLYKVPSAECRWGNIMPSGPRNFSFDGRDVFLTYPQSGELTRERVRDFLQEHAGVRRFLVSSELHDDGSPHIHAYAGWDTRRRITDERFFDVDGHHPNIQKPRSAKAVAEYCLKYDTEALCNFAVAELESYRGGTGWRDLLRECPDASTFLARVEEHYPRDLCLSLGRLLEFCEWRFGSSAQHYSGRHRSDFVEHPDLTRWVELSLEVINLYRPGWGG
jgi:hypothetical protein